MNRNIVRYQRQLKKHMPCGFQTKNDLLAEFGSSLSAFLEEQPEPTYGQLIDAFGPPEEMAKILMEAVSIKERKAYQTSKTLIKILSLILAALFIWFSLYVFFEKEFSMVTVYVKHFRPTRPILWKVIKIKRLIALCLLTTLILSCSVSAFAVEQESIVWHQETPLGNGITIIDEVIDHSLVRSSTKDYTRRRTIVDDGVTIAVISVRGIFSYDGTSVSVVSKSVTQTDTYNGWSYKQNSFTSSGGTITLDAKLTKLLVMNIPFTMTLTCDKDGNISYT